MKKARVLLTAIAVFAVVGGALAFKAKTFGQTVYCTTLASGFCNVAKPGFTTAVVPGALTTLSFCTPAAINAPCPRITIYSQL